MLGNARYCSLTFFGNAATSIREHSSEIAPNVLHFETEVLCDGRTLTRPVNYVLVRIVPGGGIDIDPAKTPFVVVDPRAGHGPGIGGMKQDSEIGVALAAGHPCYFIGFLPEPMPGQTIEDVCRAEAAFIEQVAARHPEAEGKPVVVANCQAGWQTMLMAAIRPDVCGPIVLAGSPLSYWAGVRGKNPMRYLGGVLGGSWMTQMSGDLGGGIFDGANLVANFESLNPANTYWQKPYDVYSKIDTEGPRFLDFETWWGSPVLLNAGEMQWIADNLFVGNKLTAGLIRTSGGVRVDLRNITSSIVVFCSWGDNITPHQQALGWITDIYDHEQEIASNGQTIVYTAAQLGIGHLGIFVSGAVATKEHREFTTCMDLIDMVPPGLYEAVITEVDEDTENPDLIDGRYLFRLEPRTLDHIRAFGGNSPEDDLRFATAARVSEINKGLYRTLIEPSVRALASEPMAEAMREMHPNRARFAAFSDENPLDEARRGDGEGGAAVSKARGWPDNPLLAMESSMSSWIAASLDAYGGLRDAMTEAMFLNTYGSPLLQASVGLDPHAPAAGRRIERDLMREADEARSRAVLESRFEVGGPIEAALRALIYVLLPDGGFDERGFAVLKALRAAQPPGTRPKMAELKDLLKGQYQLILLDEDRAIEAIPKLVSGSADRPAGAADALRAMISARGPLSAEGRRRLRRVEALVGARREELVGKAAHA